jgi:hypothetical protein
MDRDRKAVVSLDEETKKHIVKCTDSFGANYTSTFLTLKIDYGQHSESLWVSTSDSSIKNWSLHKNQNLKGYNLHFFCNNENCLYERYE